MFMIVLLFFVVFEVYYLFFAYFYDVLVVLVHEMFQYRIGISDLLKNIYDVHLLRELVIAFIQLPVSFEGPTVVFALA